MFRGTTFVPERQTPGPHLIDALQSGDLRFRKILRTLSRGSLSVKMSKTTLPASILYVIRLFPDGLNSLYALPCICQEKCGLSLDSRGLPSPELKEMDDFQAKKEQADRAHQWVYIGDEIGEPI